MRAFIRKFKKTVLLSLAAVIGVLLPAFSSFAFAASDHHISFVDGAYYRKYVFTSDVSIVKFYVSGGRLVSSAPVSYQYYYSNDNGVSFTRNSSGDGSSVTLNNTYTTLKDTTENIYTDSSYSSVLFGPPPPVPVSPSGVALSGSDSTSLTFSWSAVNGASGYRLYDSSNNKIYDGTALTFTVSGLTASTSYNYSVSAYNVSGESAAVPVSGSTASVPVPPTDPGGSDSGNGSTPSKGAFSISATSILADAKDFSKAFENPVLVALGLGVAITVAYAIRNMF